MSAPDTNVDKQSRRHRPSLAGMAFAVSVAAVLLAGYLFMIASAASDDADEASATTESAVTE